MKNSPHLILTLIAFLLFPGPGQASYDFSFLESAFNSSFCYWMGYETEEVVEEVRFSDFVEIGFGHFSRVFRGKGDAGENLIFKIAALNTQVFEQLPGEVFAKKADPVASQRNCQMNQLYVLARDAVVHSELSSDLPNVAASYHGFYKFKVLLADGRAAEAWMIVMEDTGQKDFFSYMEAKGDDNFNSDNLLWFVKKIIGILEQINERFLVRDLKSENIIVSSDKDLLIQDPIRFIDFGFYSRLVDGECPNSYAGTPGSIPLECALNSLGIDERQLEKKSDVWLLGMLVLFISSQGQSFFIPSELEKNFVKSYGRDSLEKIWSVVDIIKFINFRKRVSLLKEFMHPQAAAFITDILQADPEERPDYPQLLEHEIFSSQSVFSTFDLEKSQIFAKEISPIDEEILTQKPTVDELIRFAQQQWKDLDTKDPKLLKIPKGRFSAWVWQWFYPIKR